MVISLVSSLVIINLWKPQKPMGKPMETSDTARVSAATLGIPQAPESAHGAVAWPTTPGGRDPAESVVVC